MSSATAVGVAIVVLLAMATVGLFSLLPNAQLDNLRNQVSSLQSQNGSLQRQLSSLQNQTQRQNLSSIDRINTLERELVVLNSSLGRYAVNQPSIIRDVKLTWTKDLSLQDRFFGGPVVVNQGDTVRITFVSNDTVTHTFTLGPPYDFQINASLPGLKNDLTGKYFTNAATNNSPGVTVRGSKGNVSATGSFLAKYVGIYSYVCIYHVNLGMVGFLIVLPNSAYSGVQVSTTSSTMIPQSPQLSHVTILKGAANVPAANTTSLGYSPATIIVVIGVNNTVVWTNNDTVFHTVTATDRSFNSGTIYSGQSWSYTFTQAGVFTYYFCQYHPWMKGTVIVKAR